MMDKTSLQNETVVLAPLGDRLSYHRSQKAAMEAGERAYPDGAKEWTPSNEFGRYLALGERIVAEVWKGGGRVPVWCCLTADPRPDIL